MLSNMHSSPIRPLSPETICSLGKGCSFWSPWHCVQELVLNSIKACSTTVVVRLDLNPHNIRLQVLDDGCGMGRSDMWVVGRQYWTSRVATGGKGQSLASVRRVSRHVSVSSRRETGNCRKIEFIRGRRGKVEMEKVGRASSGTTVTVSGFLWNQVVRRRLVHPISDLTEVKTGLLATGLIYPGVKLSLRDDTGGSGDAVLSIRREERSIHVLTWVIRETEEGDRLTAGLAEVDMEDQGIRVKGFLCTVPHHNKRLQFLSVNKHPISHCDIHSVISSIYYRSSDFKDEKMRQKNYPVFGLEILLSPSQCDHTMEPRRSVVWFKDRVLVMTILSNVVSSFLQDKKIIKISNRSENQIPSSCMSGIKPLPPTQSSPSSSVPGYDSEPPPAVISVDSPFIFSTQVTGGRTSCPVYRKEILSNGGGGSVVKVIGPEFKESDIGEVTEPMDCVKDIVSEDEKETADTFLETDGFTLIGERHDNKKNCNKTKELIIKSRSLKVDNLSLEATLPVDGHEDKIHTDNISSKVDVSDQVLNYDDVTGLSSSSYQDLFNYVENDAAVIVQNTPVNYLERLYSDNIPRFAMAFGEDEDYYLSEKLVHQDQISSPTKISVKLPTGAPPQFSKSPSHMTSMSDGVGVSTILKRWTNPNFQFHKSNIPFTSKLVTTEHKVSKTMLVQLKLVGQVDNKYLATMCGDQLILWDQHAVHERVRLEQMLASVGSKPKSVGLDVPLEVCISQSEVSAVMSRRDECLNWGVGVVETDSPNSLFITHIPECLLPLDLSQQLEITRLLMLEFSLVVVDKLVLPGLPRTLLDHMATQACRGAVMFGHHLDNKFCLQILTELSQCHAPFQCAHGRPSLAVLGALPDLIGGHHDSH